MRTMLTTSAIALAFTASGLTPAAAAQDQQSKEAGSEQQQAASQQQMQVDDPVDLTTWAHAPLYEGWSLEDLFDADVQDQDGEELGELEDVLISPDGKAQAIVVEAGGFMDVGDTHFRVPWDEVEIAAGADDVTIPIEEDMVEDYALFEGEYVPVEMREWRATELIGDYATLEGGVGYGYVDDLIISKTGALEAVVIQPDVTYGRYAPYAYPWYGYSSGWEPGLGHYGLPYTTADIEGLEPFDYGEMNTGDDDEMAAAEDAKTQSDQKN
jgi:sporulation protein YlmC with PRC-barrel domain